MRVLLIIKYWLQYKLGRITKEELTYQWIRHQPRFYWQWKYDRANKRGR